MSWIVNLVMFLLLVKLAASLALEALNRREVSRRAAEGGGKFEKILAPPAYAKSVAYTLEKNKFSMVHQAYETVVVLATLFSGQWPRLAAWLEGRLGQGVLA